MHITEYSPATLSLNMTLARILRRSLIGLGALSVLVATMLLVHSNDAANRAHAANLRDPHFAPIATTTPGETPTTLPPSRDNDAGRSRIKDITPDADTDASQFLP